MAGPQTTTDATTRSGGQASSSSGRWGGLFGKRRSKFKSKHVFITGGSEGLGLELARQLVLKGADVSIVSRSQAKLDAAVKDIEASAKNEGIQTTVFAKSCDVGSDAQVEAAVKAAVDEHGPIDVLICNAGFSQPGLFLEQSVDVVQRQMDLNYIGAVRTVKAVAPAMVARGSGLVVLVTSALALLGFAGYSAYAPTKWALRGLADCLRNEFLGTGVSVAIAYPPDMDTPGYAKENETKARVTRAVNDALGAELFLARDVAAATLRGMERGSFHLPSPDLAQNLLIEDRVGLSSSSMWLPLRMLLAPLLVLVSWVLTGMMDRAAARHKAGTVDPDTGSTSTQRKES